MNKKKPATKLTGLMCPHCGIIIYSRNRHDFRYCKCMYCFVDGGRDYFRTGWGGPQFAEPRVMPQMVEIRILPEKKKEEDRVTAACE